MKLERVDCATSVHGLPSTGSRRMAERDFQMALARLLLIRQAWEEFSGGDESGLADLRFDEATRDRLRELRGQARGLEFTSKLLAGKFAGCSSGAATNALFAG